MDKKINLSQLADLLSQAGGMSKTASEQFAKNFFDIISQNVLSDGLVKVKGLGTFKILQMEDRESVNVNTGERFTIEGHQKISFTPDSELKERINKPFSAFETVEITAEQADEIAKAESGEEISPAVPVKPETEEEGERTDENKTANAVSPEVNDITQKKSTRVLLKILVWLLSILLALVLGVYLLWPLIGNTILGIVERDVTDSRKTEMVADSTGSTVAPVKETAPVKPVEPVTQPSVPVTQPAEPAAKPSAEPVVTPQRPATPTQKPDVKDEPLVNPLRFQLNKADEAKDLKEFTEADTVNYIMDGDMAVHVLQSGETITVLALKYYGTKKLWPYIVKYNNISNANSLRPGARIRIPVLKSK